jgi:hypothetical protein
MRFHRVQLFLGCAAIALGAAVAYCCGDYGSGRKIFLSAKLPANIGQSVISDNMLVALTTNGHLMTVDLKKGEVKDLGTFDMKPAAFLDVAAGKACVASKNRVHIVDLAAGKICCTEAFERDVQALGFLSAERVYVQNGPRVNVVDITSGKMIHTVDLGKADAKLVNGGFRTLGRSGNRLFVQVEAEKKGVAILDLDKGEVVERMAAAELRLGPDLMYVTDLHFTGDKVYVLCSRLSYGVWANSLGYVDLKTRKYTGLTLPGKLGQEPRLIAGPDGTMILASLDGAFQFDSASKLANTIPTRDGGRLLGVWNGRALISQKEELRLVRLPGVTAPAQ